MCNEATLHQFLNATQIAIIHAYGGKLLDPSFCSPTSNKAVASITHFYFYQTSSVAFQPNRQNTRCPEVVAVALFVPVSGISEPLFHYIREGKLVHMVLWKILQFPHFSVQIALILAPLTLHFPKIFLQRNPFLVQCFFFCSTMFSLKNITMHYSKLVLFHYWKVKPHFQVHPTVWLLLHYN